MELAQKYFSPSVQSLQRLPTKPNSWTRIVPSIRDLVGKVSVGLDNRKYLVRGPVMILVIRKSGKFTCFLIIIGYKMNIIILYLKMNIFKYSPTAATIAIDS